jgi:hypothetical protein
MYLLDYRVYACILSYREALFLPPLYTTFAMASVVAQKKKHAIQEQMATLPDAFSAWIDLYLALVVRGVRSREIAQKIELHLTRFTDFFQARYGHERLSLCVKRDVSAWLGQLAVEEAGGEEDAPAFAPATVNNHLASLSGFTSWVHAQRPDFFTMGNPHRWREGAPTARPGAAHALRTQVISLKSPLDRLVIPYSGASTPRQQARIR